MAQEKNEDCIRILENHEVRLKGCESNIINIWKKLDKHVLIIVGSGAFQVIAIIVAIYLKQ